MDPTKKKIANLDLTEEDEEILDRIWDKVEIVKSTTGKKYFFDGKEITPDE